MTQVLIIAEAMALNESLRLAKNLGTYNIDFESDCQVLIECITVQKNVQQNGMVVTEYILQP